MNEKIIKSRLKSIIQCLAPLHARDQRFGAKVLYGRKEFTDLISEYLVAALDLQDRWTRENFDALSRVVPPFIEFVRDLFPGQGTRILTSLRTATGASFWNLYKGSVTLAKLLEGGFSEDLELEPIDLPEQKSSPIYTKIENNRVVLDAGHALHPFLRKEGIAETRSYLHKELGELSKALRSSNVDRKYVQAFDRLALLINFEDDAGAISFGLHARLVSQLTKQIEPEISEILAVQIASTFTHAAYFASQYKDWVEFLHNAQSYPTRQAVEEEIEGALNAVTDDVAPDSYPIGIGVWGLMMPCWVMAAVRGAEPSVEQSVADRRAAA